MELKQFIEENASDLGIHQFGFMKTNQLSFAPDVRTLCEMNSCGKYGTSWSCPPGVGTYEECKEKALKYENAFIYTTKHDIEDSYDFEGMMEGGEVHGKISEKIFANIEKLLPEDRILMTGGSCQRCEKCTYPDAPCRMPDKMHPTIEAYGVEVYQIAKTLGINYINGANTVTYFGCVLY